LALLLIGLFYVLGPLALVFSIPSVSDIGTKWFSEFLSFCIWPIISGLLLRVTIALGSHLIFGTGAGSVETLASSLLMTASAIWTAFARQAAWREWVIVSLLALNALTIVAAIRAARRDPDVVVVASDGKSSYLPRSIANEALLRFLAEQKQQPSDVTVVHFTREFLHVMLAINS